jgi:O-antigen/teichoic acid export membrane protein
MLSGNTVSQFIPFLLAPILARLFSPVEFAVLANFMALTGVIGIIATGRLELAIPLPERHERAQDLAYTGTVITLVLGLASCVFAFFPDQIGNWYQDELLADYLWLVPPAVISIGLLGLINNWNLRHHKFRILSAGKITQSIVNNLGAALLGYIGWGVEGLIMAWLVSQFANILILSVGVNRRINRRDFGIDTLTSTISEFRDFPLINSLHAFTDVFVTQFLLYWIISTRFGLTELGLFAVMHKYVRAPIVLITSSVAQLYYTEAGKALQQGKAITPLFLRTIRTAGIFAVPFTAVVLLLGPVLFEWYLGAEWETAGEYARCIAPMLLMMFLVSPVSGTPILMKRQRSAFLFSIAGYSLSLGALLAAVKLGWGFSTALWCYSGAYCCYQLGLLVWFRLLIRNESHADTH